MPVHDVDPRPYGRAPQAQARGSRRGAIERGQDEGFQAAVFAAGKTWLEVTLRRTTPEKLGIEVSDLTVQTMMEDEYNDVRWGH